MSDELNRSDPWHNLSRWTAARIALGRVGVSTPTAALLAFHQDHAFARDAIYAPLKVDALQASFNAIGFPSIAVASRVRNRSEYLKRPDLGRRLDPQYVDSLQQPRKKQGHRLTVVVADGLSALAPATHALPLLEQMRPLLHHWTVDVVIASQARVALGDEIGQLREAEAVLVLIGERPGLKSPDSLGAYLTYHPRTGRMDSERNCVSNIRPEGLSYQQAASRLVHLIAKARQLGATGVPLKDDSDQHLLVNPT